MTEGEFQHISSIDRCSGKVRNTLNLANPRQTPRVRSPSDVETLERTDLDDNAGDKLVPEWGVGADDQGVLAGLAVVVALLALFGWNLWRGGDEDVAAVAESVAANPLGPVNGDNIGNGSAAGASALGSGIATNLTTPTTANAVSSAEAPATTATTAPSTTTALVESFGDVQAAVGTLPGDITGSNDGALAVLDGFVANQAESSAAEAAAREVEGIREVENNLVMLEPVVVQTLGDGGVVGPVASGVGTDITISGTIASEAQRQPMIDAMADLDGVGNVVDDLTVSVAADLNDLPQVQFATASAEILPASFPDLDRAAELIISAGDVKLEIVGWTDIEGDEDENRQLSQDRADAVRQHLINAGVDADTLTAVGNGQTDQFGAGNSAEALQANRVVLFEPRG